MNRVSDIHIEGVGTVRHLTNEDHNRIRHAARGPNRDIMPYAFSCGMSLRRFKALPVELQREVAQAFQHLCSSENIKPVERPKVDRPIFQPRIHRTDAEWSEIGRFLIQTKGSLPRGEFGPWLRDKAGLSTKAAQKAMRIARGGA
ncbi:DUF3102 domain-containing protein [Brucella anthropi]|nr:DUF3102 domain-containing protein [Brucella anthropi]